MTTHLRSTFSSFVRVGLGTLLVLLAGATTELSARTFHVFCPSLSISNILETYAQPGDTIRISGTCKERLTITKDRITLDGQGSGVLDGTGVEPSAPEFNALVTIDGARGLTLRGLTIENSSAEGILAKNGAAFALQYVTVQDNGYTGFPVSTAAMEMILAASRKKLSLVDCSSFLVMREVGVREAFCFDRHFREQGFHVLP